jgi:low temperature requirement protein LtrA
MVQRQWWQRPQLRTDEEEHRERKVSWLELFFDLVFVVVISELAHYLAGHVTLAGAIGYVLLFVPIWWSWIGGTFYNERFETEDISYRVFTFLQMLPVAAMAIFVHDGLGQASVQFALAYAAARILVTFMWLRGGWHEPRFRPVSNRYAIGFSLSIVLFLLSTLVEPPLRFVLWGIGLFSDLFTPVTTLGHQARLPRFSSSKLPERFGLFVLIVLGEAIVGVVQGVAANKEFTLTAGVTGALGMALAFGFWWVYFDFVARRQPRPGLWPQLAWNYLHLFLVMSIAAISAGIQNVLAAEQDGVGANVRWLVAGAVAGALLTIALLELTLRRPPDEPADYRVSASLKVVGALGALALGLGGGALGAAALLIALIALVLAQMLYGAYVWFHQPAPRYEEAAIE